MNSLSSFDRVIAVLQGRLPDCVPVFPVLLQQGAVELDMTLEEYFSRGEHLATGQLRLLNKFGHDCVFGIPNVIEDVTAFGAELVYFNGSPPIMGQPVIQSYYDTDQLTAPDPASSPTLNEALVALDILRSQVGGEVLVLGGCIAPFSLPSMLMGTEAWMKLLFLEEPSVRDEIMAHVLEVSTEFCVNWANMQLKAGANSIVFADGMSSAAVLTREQFIDLALPVIQSTVPQIQGPIVHEGVGDLCPMLDLLQDIGIASVMLTYNDDLDCAKDMVGNELVLVGNLNNIEMLRWSPAEMEERAIEALEKGAPGGGFILANQGPEIPLGVSDEVIHVMVQTGHNWRY